MIWGAGVAPRYLARLAHYAPGARFGPRSLDDFELVWLISGSARWRCERRESTEGPREHELVPGSVLLAPAGSVDRYVWDSRRPSSHGYLHFDWPEAPPPAERADWPLVRQPPSSAPLRTLCDYLLELSRLDDARSGERSAHLLELIVDLFVNGPLPDRGGGISSPHVRVALDWVRREWESRGLRIVSLDELASAAGVTPPHLAREFGRQFDGGLVSALELVRLGHAATRLQRSDEPLRVVARESGYGDPYHFSRRFSRVYGVAPGLYRRTRGDDPLSPVVTGGLTPVWEALERAVGSDFPRPLA